MSSNPATLELAREQGFEPYRAVSKGAVLSVILGGCSLLGLYSPTLLALAALGAVLGMMAFRTIQRYPNELTGSWLAVSGAMLGSVIFVAGVVRHSYIYATEVPEGHLRISFAELQPDKKQPHLPIPPSALELNGQKVFIKGYLYPDGQQSNITRFVLVPDLGTCCFGGQPKLTDMIEVKLEEPLQTIYSMKKRKLAGELKVDQAVKPVSGLGGVYYQLKADHLK